MKELSIYQKLFNAKKEIGKISKDSENPFFKSKYFDINSLLEHVEPILQKHGIMILQPIRDGKVITILSDFDSSIIIQSEMKLPDIQDPQKLGSAITYYRRYTLQSLLALQAEDDDANHASGNVSKKQYKDDGKPWLNEGSDEWKKVCLAIDKGQLKDISQITKYKLSKKTNDLLMKLIKG